jgi:hypothetical protein
MGVVLLVPHVSCRPSLYGCPTTPSHPPPHLPSLQGPTDAQLDGGPDGHLHGQQQAGGHQPAALGGQVHSAHHLHHVALEGHLAHCDQGGLQPQVGNGLGPGQRGNREGRRGGGEQ